jgi:hypothetical protein
MLDEDSGMAFHDAAADAERPHLEVAYRMRNSGNTAVDPGNSLTFPIVDALQATRDADNDGTVDGSDSCPFYSGASGGDTNGDGRGNNCQCSDQTGDGRITVSDLTAINNCIYNGGCTALCDGNNDGLCNVSDISAANVEIYNPKTSTCGRAQRKGV